MKTVVYHLLSESERKEVGSRPVDSPWWDPTGHEVSTTEKLRAYGSPLSVEKECVCLVEMFLTLVKGYNLCVCVHKERNSRIFLPMGMGVRYSQTPVTQPPKKTGSFSSPTLRFGVRLFSRKNTASSCRKSRYLGGGRRILDPSTSWRCQQGFEPTRETTKCGGKTFPR